MHKLLQLLICDCIIIINDSRYNYYKISYIYTVYCYTVTVILDVILLYLYCIFITVFNVSYFLKKNDKILDFKIYSNV